MIIYYSNNLIVTALHYIIHLSYYTIYIYLFNRYLVKLI